MKKFIQNSGKNFVIGGLKGYAKTIGTPSKDVPVEVQAEVEASIQKSGEMLIDGMLEGTKKNYKKFQKEHPTEAAAAKAVGGFSGISCCCRWTVQCCEDTSKLFQNIYWCCDQCMQLVNKKKRKDSNDPNAGTSATKNPLPPSTPPGIGNIELESITEVNRSLNDESSRTMSSIIQDTNSSRDISGITISNIEADGKQQDVSLNPLHQKSEQKNLSSLKQSNPRTKRADEIMRQVGEIQVLSTNENVTQNNLSLNTINQKSRQENRSGLNQSQVESIESSMQAKFNEKKERTVQSGSNPSNMKSSAPSPRRSVIGRNIGVRAVKHIDQKTNRPIDINPTIRQESFSPNLLLPSKIGSLSLSVIEQQQSKQFACIAVKTHITDIKPKSEIEAISCLLLISGFLLWVNVNLINNWNKK